MLGASALCSPGTRERPISLADDLRSPPPPLPTIRGFPVAPARRESSLGMAVRSAQKVMARDPSAVRSARRCLISYSCILSPSEQREVLARVRPSRLDRISRKPAATARRSAAPTIVMRLLVPPEIAPQPTSGRLQCRSSSGSPRDGFGSSDGAAPWMGGCCPSPRP